MGEQVKSGDIRVQHPFTIRAHAIRAMRQAGVAEEDIDAYHPAATSGSCDLKGPTTRFGS
jgi:hypothetical protein